MKKINLLETLESRQLLAANNEAASDFLHTETESLVLQLGELFGDIAKTSMIYLQGAYELLAGVNKGAAEDTNACKTYDQAVRRLGIHASIFDVMAATMIGVRCTQRSMQSADILIDQWAEVDPVCANAERSLLSEKYPEYQEYLINKAKLTTAGDSLFTQAWNFATSETEKFTYLSEASMTVAIGLATATGAIITSCFSINDNRIG